MNTYTSQLRRIKICLRVKTSASSYSLIICCLFVLLFSPRPYDLLRQKACVGSASGHIIRALCFALYENQNTIEP